MQSQLDGERALQNMQLNNVMSTTNYDTILDNVMTQLMPSYNATSAKLGDAAAANATAIDADAEKRGIYNSGAAATLQQQNREDLTQQLATLLASLQSDAVGQARDYVNQQLQAIGMAGDWTTADANTVLNSLSTYLSGLGLATDTSLGQQNANTGGRNATIGQQNANTGAQQVANDFAIDQAKLAQDAQQFADTLAFQKQVQADDMKQFSAQMQLNWAELNAQTKVSMINANANAVQSSIAAQKFQSEQQLIQAQQNKEYLADLQSAYSTLGAFEEKAKKEGWTADKLWQYESTYIKPFEQYNPDIYKDISGYVGASSTASQSVKNAGLSPVIGSSGGTTDGSSLAGWLNGVFDQLGIN
jgi:hypothetical protein